MKRILTIILSTVIALSVCACGGSKTEGTPTAAEVETTIVSSALESKDYYNVGEMVSTESFDFSLSDVAFSDSISFVLDSEDMDAYCRPTTDAKEKITADSGNKLLSFTLTLKYTGTSEMSLGLGDGEGKFLGFLVKYDDKYEFKTFSLSGSEDPVNSKSWDVYSDISGYMIALSGNTFKFKPLETNTHECRVYMQLPNQVAEKSEKPVELIVSLCDQKYAFNIAP